MHLLQNCSNQWKWLVQDCSIISRSLQQRASMLVAASSGVVHVATACLHHQGLTVQTALLTSSAVRSAQHTHQKPMSNRASRPRARLLTLSLCIHIAEPNRRRGVWSSCSGRHGWLRQHWFPRVFTGLVFVQHVHARTNTYRDISHGTHHISIQSLLFAFEILCFTQARNLSHSNNVWALLDAFV